MKLSSTDFIAEYLKHNNIKKASKALRSQGYRFCDKWARKVLNDHKSKPLISGTKKTPDQLRKNLHGKRFVFTSAQNSTELHEEFYASLLNFCEHNNARLVVGTFTYAKNEQERKEKTDDACWYDPRIRGNIINESCNLDCGAVWSGELNILPTASNPESSLDTYNGSSSFIIPHAKCRLKTIPTIKHDPAKFIFTTGAITKRKYIEKKAGQKAAFHHSFSALYVEMDDQGNWFPRHLEADYDGCFYDLKKHYTPDGVTDGHRLEALQLGDLHQYQMPINRESIYHDMVDYFKPKYLFLHDALDFYTRNHHNIKDKFFWARTHYENKNSVLHEIKSLGAFLDRIKRDFCKTIIVESNHDLALKKWLTTANVDFDPVNGEFYHDCNRRMYKAAREGDYDFQILKWAIEKYADHKDSLFLKQDESFRICDPNGIECAMHGHLGSNGARGTPQGLSKIGCKANLGHTHTPSIIDGVRTAGVSGSLDHGYNNGPSSWANAHIATYKNGKRPILIEMNGKFKA